MRDIQLPHLFSAMRSTLLQANWVITHSNPEDTFVCLTSPDAVLRCVLHYMPDAKAVYPDGSWTLKLNTDEGTWQVETATRPIMETPVEFMRDFKRLLSISEVLKDQIVKDPF